MLGLGSFSPGNPLEAQLSVFYGLSPVVSSVPAVCSPLLRRGGMSEAETSPASPQCVRNHMDMQVNSSVLQMLFLLYKHIPGFKNNKTKRRQTLLMSNESSSSEHHGWAQLSSLPLDVKSLL